MVTDKKKHYLEKITKSHAELQTDLDGIDLEQCIHPDTNWRIRDILGHLATWDREVAKSLAAYLNGDEYFIIDLDEEETDFNGRAVAEQRNLTTEQIVEEWHRARDEVKAVVSAIPPELYPGDLRYPWGEEHGSIAGLIDFLVEHDQQHQDEILKAVEKN